MQCAAYDTARPHQPNAAIVVTNDRNPLSAMVVLKYFLSIKKTLRVLSKAGGGMKFDGGSCLTILYAGKKTLLGSSSRNCQTVHRKERQKTLGKKPKSDSRHPDSDRGPETCQGLWIFTLLRPS